MHCMDQRSSNPNKKGTRVSYGLGHHMTIEESLERRQQQNRQTENMLSGDGLLRLQDGPQPSHFRQRRVSRIPALKCRGEVKEVAHCKKLTVHNQMADFVKVVQRLMLGSEPQGPPPRRPVNRPPAHRANASQSTDHQTSMKAKVATRPSGLAPRHPVRRASEVNDVPLFHKGPPGPTARRPHASVSCKPGPENRVSRAEAMEKLKSLHLSERPYPNPVSRLSEALKLLRMSDTEWTKKMIALETLQMLIVHHPHMVAEKRPIISVALINEGNSKRLRLACAALDTIALMFLRMFMDADVEIATKSMLLLLAKDSIMSLKERVHLALYCLARSCSCSRFIIALLKCGQGHSSNCLRAGTIEQIGHLVDLNGADKIFASMRHSNKQLVIALSKMALDRAPEVRHEAQRILKAFIHIPEFRKILTDVVPFKNKKQMDTILKGLM